MSITYTFTCDKCAGYQRIDTDDEFLKVSEQKTYIYILREDHQHADYEHLCQECMEQLDEEELAE